MALKLRIHYNGKLSTMTFRKNDLLRDVAIKI